MIYTVTLNPALDVSGKVDELIPDEKSYVFEEVITPGGNGINAGIIAQRLGAKVTACGFLGGSNGIEIKRLLKATKLHEKFINIQGKTRMNLTVSNLKTHKQTRLSFPGPKIRAQEMKSLEAQLLKTKKTDLIVIGGSLPPNLKPTALAGLIKKLKTKGQKVLVDIPGKPLKAALKARPDFIKPNLVEFQDLVGEKVSTMGEILPLVRKLNLPLVCVSSVEGGAILVSKEEAWFGKIPPVKIVSTVGAGDSMVGAISYGLTQGCSLEELLRWGLASACATLTETGLTLGSPKNIKKYYPQIIMRKL
jgi:1-phosphofructokinase family hexose kinase